MDAPTAHFTTWVIIPLRRPASASVFLSFTFFSSRGGEEPTWLQREALEGLRRFRCHGLPQLRHRIGFLGLDKHVAISVEELDQQRRA